MRREGSWARIAWAGGKVSTMETVGRVERVKRQLDAEPGLNDWTRMAVDADGVGGGVVDRLRELGHSATEIHGGRPSAEPDDYVNLRSEWYWNLRQRFEEGDIDIDPDDAVLAKQLVAIKYKVTSKGQIAVETKDEMRKRKVPSPDRADALAYAFTNMAAATVDVDSHQGQSITGDLMEKAW